MGTILNISELRRKLGDIPIKGSWDNNLCPTYGQLMSGEICSTDRLRIETYSVGDGKTRYDNNQLVCEEDVKIVSQYLLTVFTNTSDNIIVNGTPRAVTRSGASYYYTESFNKGTTVNVSTQDSHTEESASSWVLKNKEYALRVGQSSIHLDWDALGQGTNISATSQSTSSRTVTTSSYTKSQSSVTINDNTTVTFNYLATSSKTEDKKGDIELSDEVQVSDCSPFSATITTHRLDLEHGVPTHTVVISTSVNDTTTPRTATLTIKNGDKEEDVEIIQDAKPAPSDPIYKLVVDDTTLMSNGTTSGTYLRNVGAESEASATISVATYVSTDNGATWQESSEPAINVDDRSGLLGSWRYVNSQKKIIYDINENSSEEEREGSFFITHDGRLSFQYNINQNGAKPAPVEYSLYTVIPGSKILYSTGLTSTTVELTWQSQSSSMVYPFFAVFRKEGEGVWINDNDSWEFESEGGDWVTFAKKSNIEQQNVSLFSRVTDNTSIEPRKATVTVLYNGLRYTLNITQKGIEVTPTRWYNGDTLIKELDVVGELDKSLKETSCTRCEIGDSVTSIGSYAFYECSNLTSITIPNSVTAINDYAFQDCKMLPSIIIPNGVTEIDYRIFGYCSNLTSVTIPNSVTKINSYAFDGCTNLVSVIIPDSVTEIYTGAFNKCSSLTSITIPNNITNIPNYTFSNCSNLKSVIIGSGVKNINNESFSKCSSLTSIIIPNSVTSIGEHTFSYCSNLTSVTIGNNVSSIGYGAFARCSSITSITIPNSVSNIGRYIFGYNEKLTSIIYNGTIEQWNAINKHTYWNESMASSCIVHCTDGDIPIEYA